MKHEMPVMTEEKRQALIERCEKKIKELSKVEFGIMHTDKLDLLIYCEDYAALTVPPVPVIPKKLRPDDFSPKGWIVSHDYRQGFNEAIEEIEGLNKVRE